MTVKTLIELKRKLNTLAIISNEQRFNILLALLSSDILKLGKHSHTFTELKEIVGISNSDLGYHLNELKDVGLITKKEYQERDRKTTYYEIKEEGKRLLSSIGLTAKFIKETRKKIDSK